MIMQLNHNFITFEGIDGSGKTTQAQMAANALRAEGCDVLLTREPGGSEGAMAIRKLLVEGDANRWDGVTETLLHFAARRDHLQKTVIPALEAGHIVICDRFIDSTRAYQGGGHGVDARLIESLHQSCCGGLEPGMTIFADISPDAAARRISSSTDTHRTYEDRYEKMGDGFSQRVYRHFLTLAREHPSRIITIDASGDIERVHRDIMQHIRAHI